MIDMRGDGNENNGNNFYFLVDENQRNAKVKGTVMINGHGEVRTNPFPVLLNKFQHYCTTRRSGKGTYFYVSGKVSKSGGASSKKLSTPNNFRVGTYAGGSKGQYFTHGNICAVRVYNKALSTAEIGQLFHAGVCK